VPVEFLSDDEAFSYGRFNGVPSRAELERVFFLDDADRSLIARRRGAHHRLGFALQLTTVRSLGMFLADPLEVPSAVVEYLAGQLAIADVGCVGRYTERRTTRFEHAEEIKVAYGLKDFASAEKDLERWADARAWTTGDGPKAIFNDAIAWLFERDVLLPGVTTLARLVARVRDEATQRLWDTLSALLTGQQRGMLERLLDIPDGARFSDLERWRKGPAKPSGKNLEKALARVQEIAAMGLGTLDLDAIVPHRRLVDLARYGMAAKARQLRRHPPSRRLATLLATAVYLEARSIDDCLELLDLLMVTELLGKAERASKDEKVRQHPRLARASAKLAAAVDVLLEATGGGETIGVADLWGLIETVASRAELQAAVAVISEIVPPPEGDDEGAARALLATRIAMVSGFLKTLTAVIDFGASADAVPVLAAMQQMPDLLRRRRELTVQDIDESLVQGSWKRLVFGSPPTGAVEKNAYVFCVLTQFHRHLKRRELYAEASSRWRDPRAQLLDGDAWMNAKEPVLRALSLPSNPEDLLSGQSRILDAAYRDVGGQLDVNTAVSVDDNGRLHVESLRAIDERPSLIELRKMVNALLPRVDLSRADPGGDGVGAGVRRGVHRGLGRPDPPRRLGRHDRCLPDRACPEHRVLPDRQEGRQGARARPHQPRQPELPRDRDLRARQRAADRSPGGHLARSGLGRWPGRRDRRDALRRSHPQHLRPPESQVLRLQARRHLAEHDQRPGVRADREGRLGDRPRLAAHDRRCVQPGRRAAPPTSSSPTPGPTATWCSGSRSCSGWSTAPSSPTCPTNDCGASNATRTTAR